MYNVIITVNVVSVISAVLFSNPFIKIFLFPQQLYNAPGLEKIPFLVNHCQIQILYTALIEKHIGSRGRKGAPTYQAV